MDQAPEAPRRTELHDLFDVHNPAAELWRDLLVHEHLAADQQLALHGCSKGTKDLVLKTARRATVTLHLDNDGVPLQPDLQAYRVSVASRELKMRGQLPTKVILRTGCDDTGTLTLALVCLQEGAAHLHELDMAASGALPRSLLETAGRCCPNLTALMLRSGVEAMPSPSHLPHLRSLTILGDPTVHQTWRTVNASVQPYLSHLSHLHLRRACIHDFFQPSTITTTLRTLVLERTWLNDRWLRLLLKCAPALEDLTVEKVNLFASASAVTSCKWRRLTCHIICIMGLVRLPLPEGITITAAEFYPYFQEFRKEAVAAGITRLKERRAVLVYREAVVGCTVLNGQDREPALLRRSLEVLQALPAPPNGAVYLSRWTMSAALMRELQGLPRLSTLTLAQFQWLPEPMLYTPLLRLLPDSFREVQITKCASKTQVEGICFGAPFNRTAEHPLTIALECPADVIVTINQDMQHSGWEHVTVKGL